MPTYQAPIVGMAFRPPAADIINLLPANTELLLVREPDNPYDTDAIKVMLPGFSAEGQAQEVFKIMLEQIENDQFGNLKWTRESLTDPIQLGYIANAEKTGGKFASELSPIMDEAAQVKADWEGKLVFNAAGKPCARIVIGEATEENTPPGEEHKRQYPKSTNENLTPLNDPDDEIPF